MSLKKLGLLSFLLLGTLSMFLLSACGISIPPGGASQSLLTSVGNQPQNASPDVSTSTTCPAPGTGRAAVLPPLTLGSHQNIVYTSNTFNNNGQPLTGALKRYDVVTKATTNIKTMSQKSIFGVQISANGQWILFTTEQIVHGSPLLKLQLVRMDGRHLQTLYCGPSLFGAQWSTDQKLIVFSTNANGTQNVNVLDATTGAVQADLSVPDTSGVIVRTWLDTKRIYITNTQIDQPPNIIYLLDTSKGANQQLSNLPVVFNGNFSDFDSSYNGTQLFISSCACGQGGNTGPSSITVQPALGGQSQTLYSTPTYAVTSVRAVTPTVLLFVIYNYVIIGKTDTTHNGLWKMNTDGSGLTRLTTDPAGQASGLNSASQFPWSNVSRDNSMYGLQTTGNQTQALLAGPLSGGTPTTFASFNGSGTSLSIVGWTTM